MKKKKKVQIKNLQNYSKICTPYNIRLTHVGVEGDTHTVLPSRLSKEYAKMASSPHLFCLVDLSLDVYIIFLVSGAMLQFSIWATRFFGYTF